MNDSGLNRYRSRQIDNSLLVQPSKEPEENRNDNGSAGITRYIAMRKICSTEDSIFDSLENLSEPLPDLEHFVQPALIFCTP